MRCVMCGRSKKLFAYNLPRVPPITSWLHLFNALEQLVPVDATDATRAACVATIEEVCRLILEKQEPPKRLRIKGSLQTFADLKSNLHRFPEAKDLDISYVCRRLYRLERPTHLNIWLNQCSAVLRDEFLETMADGSETIIRELDSLWTERVLFSGRRRITDVNINLLLNSQNGSSFELESLMSSSYHEGNTNWFADIRQNHRFDKPTDEINEGIEGIETDTKVKLAINIDELLAFKGHELTSYIIDMNFRKQTLRPEPDFNGRLEEEEVLIRPGVHLQLVDTVYSIHYTVFHFNLLTTKAPREAKRIHMGSEARPPRLQDFLAYN
jgi:hypothetical protein